jgi:hypothetical protein
MDKKGNLDGITDQGDGISCNNYGCGTIYEISPSGSEKVLYSFSGGSDGWSPNAGFIADKSGNLYSTAEGCGINHYGVVFKFSP